MKLISGRSLSEHIREARSLSGRLALVPKVTAVSEAIACAHTQRVIHRDLKPANTIIGAFGEVMVIDWGVRSAGGGRAEVVSSP
jgi:serine/threonine protein kinase